MVVATIHDPATPPTLEPVGGMLRGERRRQAQAALNSWLTAEWHRQEETIQQLHERLDRAEADANHWAEVAQQNEVQGIQEALLAESEKAVKRWQFAAEGWSKRALRAERMFDDTCHEMELMRERLTFQLESEEKSKRYFLEQCERQIELREESERSLRELRFELKQQVHWKQAWYRLFKQYGDLQRLNRKMFACILILAACFVSLVVYDIWGGV